MKGGETELSNFWAHFLKTKSQPIATCSNAIFLVTRTSDSLRLKAGSVDGLGTSATPGMARGLAANPSLLSLVGPVPFEDVYTGTGEVMAVLYLTHMFNNLHQSLEVERSRLVSLDDLRTHDVIFLGSTKEDTLLVMLLAANDFVFKWPGKPTGAWDGKVVDSYPHPEERPSYGVERDPKMGELLADYALISVLPGIVSGRKVIVLGGLTTLGTQGAAEFATSPEGVADVFPDMGVTDSVTQEKLPAFFQAVLKVSIMKGEILNIKCVGAHIVHTAQGSSAQG